jgi:DNA repair exonuclease SbcCD ATPase subunit
MNTDALFQRFDRLRQQVDRKAVELELLQKSRGKAEDSLLELTRSSKLHDEAHRLLEVFVRSTEGAVREYIEPLITEALDFVFCQGLQFHLLFVNRRNQVEVDFIVLRTLEAESIYQEGTGESDVDEVELSLLIKESKNINFMYGGAVNQVIALVLRLVLAELLKVKGPIVLDEPSSAVGEEYSARLGQLLVSLSQRFDRQYILITHSKTLASFAETVYEVEKVDGVSHASLQV